jgi:hypothetical protein
LIDLSGLSEFQFQDPFFGIVTHGRNAAGINRKPAHYLPLRNHVSSFSHERPGRIDVGGVEEIQAGFKAVSTRRVASWTSVLPQAEKNSPLPPKVPQPKLRTGTFNPEITKLSEFHDFHGCRRLPGDANINHVAGMLRVSDSDSVWFDLASVWTTMSVASRTTGEIDVIPQIDWVDRGVCNRHSGVGATA